MTAPLKCPTCGQLKQTYGMGFANAVVMMGLILLGFFLREWLR